MSIFKKRSIRSLVGQKKSDIPEGLWNKCPSCSQMLVQTDLKQRLRVCPNCEHHFTMTAPERIEMLLDPGSFKEMDQNLTSIDALGFKGYLDKVKSYQQKTGMKDALLSGRGTIGDLPVAIGVMDFRFLGASMGSVVGEKVTRVIETATKEERAAIIVSASGGARMHEGILSLMQMGKSSAALARHAEAGLPYISILTHPTTGGVTASFATTGDIILAEPKCMIGFAGPRVVKETTHQNLPEGFQTAEFMMEHGLIDRIVKRGEMRDTLTKILRYALPQNAAAA